MMRHQKEQSLSPTGGPHGVTASLAGAFSPCAVAPQFQKLKDALIAAIQQYQQTAELTVVDNPLRGKWRAARLLEAFEKLKLTDSSNPEDHEQQQRKVLLCYLLAMFLYESGRLVDSLRDILLGKPGNAGFFNSNEVFSQEFHLKSNGLKIEAIERQYHLENIPGNHLKNYVTWRAVPTSGILNSDLLTFSKDSLNPQQIATKLQTAAQYYRERHKKNSSKKAAGIERAANFGLLMAYVSQSTNPTIALRESIYLLIERTSSTDFKNDVLATIGHTEDRVKSLIENPDYSYLHKLTAHHAKMLFEEITSELRNTPIQTVKNDGSEEALYTPPLPLQQSHNAAIRINWSAFKASLISAATEYLNEKKQEKGLRSAVTEVLSDEFRIGVARAKHFIHALEKIEPEQVGDAARQLVTLACAVVFESTSTKLKEKIVGKPHCNRSLLAMLRVPLDVTIKDTIDQVKTLDQLTSVDDFNELKNRAIQAATAYRTAGLGGFDGKCRAEGFIRVMQQARQSADIITLLNCIVEHSGSTWFKTAILDFVASIPPHGLTQKGLKDLAKQYEIKEISDEKLLANTSDIISDYEKLSLALKKAVALCLKNAPANDQDSRNAAKKLKELLSPTTDKSVAPSNDRESPPPTQSPLLSSPVMQDVSESGPFAPQSQLNEKEQERHQALLVEAYHILMNSPGYLSTEVAACVAATPALIKTQLIALNYDTVNLPTPFFTIEPVAATIIAQASSLSRTMQAVAPRPVRTAEIPSLHTPELASLKIEESKLVWTAEQYGTFKEGVKNAIDSYLRANVGNEKERRQVFVFYQILQKLDENDINAQQQLLSLANRVITSTEFKEAFLPRLLIHTGMSEIELKTSLKELFVMSASRDEEEVKSTAASVGSSSEEQKKDERKTFLANVTLALDAYQIHNLGGSEGKKRAARLRVALNQYEKNNSSDNAYQLVMSLTDIVHPAKVLKEMIEIATGKTWGEIVVLKPQGPIHLNLSENSPNLDQSGFNCVRSSLTETAERYFKRPLSQQDSKKAIRIHNFIDAITDLNGLALADQWRELIRITKLFVDYAKTGIEEDLIASINVLFSSKKSFLGDSHSLEQDIENTYGAIFHLDKKDAKKIFDDEIVYSKKIEDWKCNQSVASDVEKALTQYKRGASLSATEAMRQGDEGYLRAKNFLNDFEVIKNALAHPSNDQHDSARKTFITMMCAIVFQSTSATLSNKLLTAAGMTKHQLKKLQVDLHISNNAARNKLFELEAKTRITDWRKFRIDLYHALTRTLDSGLLKDAKDACNRDFVRKLAGAINTPLTDPLSHQDKAALIRCAEMGFNRDIPALSAAITDFTSYSVTQFHDLQLFYGITNEKIMDANFHYTHVSDVSLYKILLSAAEYCEKTDIKAAMRDKATQLKNALLMQNFNIYRHSNSPASQTTEHDRLTVQYRLIALAVAVIKSPEMPQALQTAVTELLPYATPTTALEKALRAYERQNNDVNRVIISAENAKTIKTQVSQNLGISFNWKANEASVESRGLGIISARRHLDGTAEDSDNDIPLAITGNSAAFFSSSSTTTAAATATPQSTNPLTTLPDDWTSQTKKAIFKAIQYYLTPKEGKIIAQDVVSESEPLYHYSEFEGQSHGVVRAKVLAKALKEIDLASDNGKQQLAQLLCAVVLHTSSKKSAGLSEDLRARILILADFNLLQVKTLQAVYGIEKECAYIADKLIDAKQLGYRQSFFVTCTANFEQLKTNLVNAANQYLHCAGKDRRATNKIPTHGVRHAANLLARLSDITTPISDRELALIVCAFTKGFSKEIAKNEITFNDAVNASEQLKQSYFISGAEIMAYASSVREGDAGGARALEYLKAHSGNDVELTPTFS